jgi:predicted  nucleic acid-binding Zn-ribbon protein
MTETIIDREPIRIEYTSLSDKIKELNAQVAELKKTNLKQCDRIRELYAPHADLLLKLEQSEKEAAHYRGQGQVLIDRTNRLEKNLAEAQEKNIKLVKSICWILERIGRAQRDR